MQPNDQKVQPARLLWTDGSAKPNPGKGGFAVLEKIGGRAVPVVMGKCNYTTSIRMEGIALVEAMKYVDGDKTTIFTDSKFWINVLKKWAAGWEQNGWQKKTPGEIKNLDIVQQVWALYQRGNIKVKWVKGHAGSRFNNLADKFAKRASKGKIEDNLTHQKAP